MAVQSYIYLIYGILDIYLLLMSHILEIFIVNESYTIICSPFFNKYSPFIFRDLLYNFFIPWHQHCYRDLLLMYMF